MLATRFEAIMKVNSRVLIAAAFLLRSQDETGTVIGIPKAVMKLAMNFYCKKYNIQLNINSEVNSSSYESVAVQILQKKLN